MSLLRGAQVAVDVDYGHELGIGRGWADAVTRLLIIPAEELSHGEVGSPHRPDRKKQGCYDMILILPIYILAY